MEDKKQCFLYTKNNVTGVICNKVYKINPKDELISKLKYLTSYVSGEYAHCADVISS